MVARVASTPFVRPDPKPVLPGALLLTAPDIAALTDRLAATLAHEGIGGHLCVRVAEGADTPLFGDAPTLFPRRHSPRVRRIAGPPGRRDALDLLVAAPAAPLPRAAEARLQGYAELYLARAALLREKSGDLATGCPLSLRQRVILGRLLAGQPLARIAAALDISVEAARSHLEDALAALGAASRAEAVALAARRGWLVLSPRSSGL
jgi:DNA-binding CsgD family transcriptional regulator